MKLIFAMLALTPMCLPASQIDEDFFHEVINEEIMQSACKRYAISQFYSERIDQKEVNCACNDPKHMKDLLISLQVWYQTGYERGLLTAEDILSQSKQ